MAPLESDQSNRATVGSYSPFGGFGQKPNRPYNLPPVKAVNSGG